MKTIGERFDEMAEAAGVSKFDKNYYFGMSCCFQIATEQKEHDIKVLSKVYADLLSAKGYDIGTINSELARLQKEIKEE